jgi:dihydroorotate dehydrogenase
MIMTIASYILGGLPPETAHGATIRLTRLFGGFFPPAPPDDPRLSVAALGRLFPNPVGLAAGFDKDALVPGAMARFGFGFVECGTVTPRPQRGNPRPRLFRLAEDGAVINRMGFNNGGMEAAARNLAHSRGDGITGINIGANKDSADRIADYVQAFARLAQLADYVTVNVCSPITPGLRGLQNREELTKLLVLLIAARENLPRARSADGGGSRSSACDAKAGGGNQIPLLLKIAPDLDEAALDEIAEVVLVSGIDGMIVSNTMLARPALQSIHRGEVGGLSGRPLFAPSTAILKAMRRRVGGRIVLIGVGGIESGADAYAKIRAGASLVQLYTALAYRGPGLVARIKRELLECLVRDGFSTVGEAVGADMP